MQAVRREHPAYIPILRLILWSVLVAQPNDLLAQICTQVLRVDELHIVPRGHWLDRAMSRFERVANMRRLLLDRVLQL